MIEEEGRKRRKGEDVEGEEVGEEEKKEEKKEKKEKKTAEHSNITLA